MDLALIVAISSNNVIGNNGVLPWPNYSADMQRFRRLTTGHPVIMGRNTYDSLPKNFRPLPKRTNIVLSHRPVSEQGVMIFQTLDEAIRYAETKDTQEAYVIGGSSVYAEALPRADRLEITHVKKEFQGDTYFPEVDWNEWEIINSTKPEPDLTFVTYRRKLEREVA